MKNPKKSILLLLVILTLFAVSCGSTPDTGASEAEQTLQVIYAENTAQAELAAAEVEEAAPAEEPTKPPPKPEPLMMPGEPPPPERTLEDSDSSIRAYENRTLSGDNFLDNLYERPFTPFEMEYISDLDIYNVDFAYDEVFYYFTINIYELMPEMELPTGMYAIEFDRTKTGRGDLFVMVERARPEWSPEGVFVFFDENADVGGPTPIIADEGFQGTGYDGRVKLEGEAAAFARIAPDSPESVQIAVSKALLEDPEEFLWSAWAGRELGNVGSFDYNDTMGPSEAGSPILGEDYPIKALAFLDNTCRLPFGFEQMGSTVPGVCVTVAPVEDKECVCVQWRQNVCYAWDCN